ncbi:MAG: hypothetical protein R3D44_11770 [Hyphomicrobiaceae bacterium]
MLRILDWASRIAAVSAVLIVASAQFPAMAQSDPSGTAVSPLKTVDLTPEELAEREARKACKVRICAAFRNPKADAPDVTCSVLKSWRKEQLSKMTQKAKVSWPWGRVKCTADIKLRHEMLTKAMAGDRYEAKLDTHQVACEVERDKDGPAQIKFEFTPKVTFDKGKAVKAALGWGKVEAPTLLKGAMWTVTATDNTFNVLQGTIVEDINDFIGPRCDEVKSDWSGK